jgi:hypothetical protein
MGTESKIEQKVCHHMLLKLGIPNTKWGVDGWPDRIFFIPPAKTVFVEYKAPGGQLMPRQAYRIKCLRTWGFKVFIHDDAAESIRDLTREVESARPTMGGKSTEPARPALLRSRQRVL